MKVKLKPNGGKEESKIAFTLIITGILTWGGGTIAAIICWANDIVGIGFGVLGVAFVSGLLLLGIAKIIKTLVHIQSQSYEVFLDDDVFTKSLTMTSKEKKVVQEDAVEKEQLSVERKNNQCKYCGCEKIDSDGYCEKCGMKFY